MIALLAVLFFLTFSTCKIIEWLYRRHDRKFVNAELRAMLLEIFSEER